MQVWQTFNELLCCAPTHPPTHHVGMQVPQHFSTPVTNTQAITCIPTQLITTRLPPPPQKIYLERLGFRFLDKRGVYGMAGFAIMLAVEALYDLSLLNCRCCGVWPTCTNAFYATCQLSPHDP